MKCLQGGAKFNKWTLLYYQSEYRSPSGRKHGEYWMAICDCGTTKPVLLQNVRRGLSKSCGCTNLDSLVARSKTHGMTRSKTYKIWCGMKRRCYNPNEKFYSHYGGRGIVVCDRWKNSFEAFLSDMGECPEGLSIERKDVNGNYEPSNCIWLPEELQGQNTRKSKLDLAKAVEILRLKRSGMISKDVAALYDVDKSMVDKIVRGENWKNAHEVLGHECA